MTDVAPDRCPEAEILAQFAEGTLDTVTHAQVARHVAGCAGCPLIVGETVRFLNRDAERPSRRRTGWPLALAAALAVMIPTVIWRLFASDPMTRVREAAASASRRPAEGHLEGFAWAPFEARRSKQERPIELDLEVAARRVIRSRSHGPAALHDRGVALLILGRTSESVAALRSAVQLAPQEPNYWNDLAVTLIARGDATAYAEAVAAADRAIELSPSLAAAHFNRALALERLTRLDDALAAYRRAEAVTPPSLWQEEVKMRIRRLELGR